MMETNTMNQQELLKCKYSEFFLRLNEFLDEYKRNRKDGEHKKNNPGSGETSSGSIEGKIEN